MIVIPMGWDNKTLVELAMTVERRMTGGGLGNDPEFDCGGCIYWRS